VSRLRSGTFAAWCCAWLDGAAASDDVLQAVTGDDAPHVVEGLPGSADPAPLSEVLFVLRRTGARPRVILPAPGDLRGVPTGDEFRVASLDAGEAVAAGSLGLVPDIVDYTPSSAPTSVTWHAYAVQPVVPDHIGLADAGQDLTTAVRDCTAALTAADVSGASADIGEALQLARRAGERLVLPPSFPPRAVALLARAEQLHDVLELAFAEPFGGAVDRFSASARDASLRPLATAVRRARLAGYNALADTG
jgi:hypothetical protein